MPNACLINHPSSGLPPIEFSASRLKHCWALHAPEARGDEILKISTTGAVTRHGVINWEEFGQKFWWVVLHSTRSTKTPRKFRPKSRPILRPISESVSTGVWCVPGFAAGFEIALQHTELQKEGQNYFLRQALVCTKPCFKRDLTIRAPRISPGHKHSSPQFRSGACQV